jgi:hypothetical protein
MEDIKLKVVEAIKIVEDIPEEYKLTAFEIVLKKMLSEQGSIHIDNEPEITVQQPVIPNNNNGNGNGNGNGNVAIEQIGFGRLVNEFNINESVLNDIFKVDTAKKAIKINFQFNTPSDRENQFTTALIYIAAKKYVFGDDSATSRELTELMKNMGINSLQNLTANLYKANDAYAKKNGKKLIIVSGISGGKKIYRLTDVGFTESKRIIKAHIEGTA